MRRPINPIMWPGFYSRWILLSTTLRRVGVESGHAAALNLTGRSRLGCPLAVPVWGVAGRNAGIRGGEEVAEVGANSEDVRPLVEPEGAHVIGPLGLRLLVDRDARIDVDRVLALGQEVGQLRIVDPGPVRPRGVRGTRDLTRKRGGRPGVRIRRKAVGVERHIVLAGGVDAAARPAVEELPGWPVLGRDRGADLLPVADQELLLGRPLRVAGGGAQHPRQLDAALTAGAVSRLGPPVLVEERVRLADVAGEGRNAGVVVE